MTAERDRRADVLAAARRLFEAHGYASVTVRDIAAEAGVSPALVIKHHASKAELFAQVGPPEIPLGELDLPAADVGRTLVARILDRRDRDEPELWLQLCRQINDSPDSERTREQVRAGLLDEVGRLAGDRSPDKVNAAAIVSVLIGIAAGLRTVGVHEGSTRAELLDLYGPLVQQFVTDTA
ncbi:TetR family transcriptional regulator [Microlunatus sp. Y2014]|uniref:TetR/AcrR family transcriptional regulator n=1 Tax=Microlunatus sp. Y2014 TaxID=3418488 RepID=UPI003DA6F82A